MNNLTEPEEDFSLDTPSSEIANRLFFRLFQAANLMHKEGTQALESSGITTQQWSVLGALSRDSFVDKGMSVGELAEYLKVSRQSLSGTLKILESKGAIERVQDSRDRRSRNIRLTPAGKKTWKKIQPDIGEFYQHALRGLSGDDQIAIVHYLNVLRNNMAKVC